MQPCGTLYRTAMILSTTEAVLNSMLTEVRAVIINGKNSLVISELMEAIDVLISTLTE
jgi:hypothetical protein